MAGTGSPVVGADNLAGSLHGLGCKGEEAVGNSSVEWRLRERRKARRGDA